MRVFTVPTMMSGEPQPNKCLAPDHPDEEMFDLIFVGSGDT